MPEITETQIKAIAQAVSESIDNKANAFYVDREKHWKHHEFLDRSIDFLSETRGIIWKVIVVAFIGLVIGIFAIGFTLWSGKG